MYCIRDKNNLILRVISIPILLSIFFPLIISDLWIEIYHRLCFPLYGLKYVTRGNYIRVDRHKLKYLKWHQKIGCAYCGYANGLLAYWVKIGAVTEKYFCGIMHKNGGGFIPPSHHKNFTKYENEEEFIKMYG